MLSEKILKILQSHLGKGGKVLIWQIEKIYQLRVLYVLLFSNEMHHSHKLILSRAVQKVYFQLITRRSHLCTRLHPSQTSKLQFLRNNFEISYPQVVRTFDCKCFLQLFLCEYIPVLTYVRVQHVLWEVMRRCTFLASKENCMAFKEICMFCGLSKKDCQIYCVLHIHSFRKQHILQKKMWF